MKTVQFKCPFCSTSLVFDKSRGGEAISCPSCSEAISIPRKKPEAFSYFVTAIIGVVIIAAFAATVMIVYILKFNSGSNNVSPFVKPVETLSPLEQLKYHAKKGDAESQFNLAGVLFTGDGVRRDVDEAVKWLTKSANAGYISSQSALGFIYIQGDGVPKDVNKAIKWFELAAAKGDADSQLVLGELYETGEGVVKDYVRAAKYYKMAADNGNQEAQAGLMRVAKGQVAVWLNGSADDGRWIPQAMFDIFHPIGTAKNIRVDEVSFEPETVITLTLFWEGPIITDGFTRMRWSESYGLQLLETNGFTNDDCSEAAAGLLAGFVAGLLEE